MITKDTLVEDLVAIPGIITFCIQHGFSLIACADTFPKSIGELLAIKKIGNPDAIIAELNNYVRGLEFISKQ